jgi:hypothetical protein
MRDHVTKEIAGSTIFDTEVGRCGKRTQIALLQIETSESVKHSCLV